MPVHQHFSAIFPKMSPFFFVRFYFLLKFSLHNWHRCRGRGGIWVFWYLQPIVFSYWRTFSCYFVWYYFPIFQIPAAMCHLVLFLAVDTTQFCSSWAPCCPGPFLADLFPTVHFSEQAGVNYLVYGNPGVKWNVHSDDENPSSLSLKTLCFQLFFL